jgi:hypothetical protein
MLSDKDPNARSIDRPALIVKAADPLTGAFQYGDTQTRLVITSPSPEATRFHVRYDIKNYC